MTAESVALIGCGYWGKNLARALARLESLAAVVDDNPQTAATIAQQHGSTVAALDEVLADDSISAVAIATPAATHAAVASAAFRAGKDVFVEKPMALHPDDARAMVALAQQESRLLMVGHLLQYHPAFLRLKELVNAGQLGRLQYVYSNRLNFGKIRREEDVLWSFAPHDLSMILGLAGERPDSVRTEGRFVLHGRIADVTTTHLTFPSGLAAHVFVSWLHPGKEQRLVVIGDEAMAVFDDRRPREEKLALHRSRVEWLDGHPTAAAVEPEFVAVPDEEPLLNEMRHFIECVQTRATPRTDGHEGLRVLDLLTEASRQLTADRSSPPPAADEMGDATATAATDQPLAERPGPGVHPTAVIDSGVEIGDNTKIWHYSHIMPKTIIGRNCSLGQNVVAGPNVRIGDGVKIQNNVSVYEGVTLEDDVFCGPSMVFTNVVNPRAFVSRKDEFAATLVRRGASIGANATVVCGTTIGSYAFVAAGAVVTKDVPDHALMVGVPARQVGWVSHEGEILGDDMTCPRTGQRYAVDAGRLVEVSAEAEETTTQNEGADND